MFCAMTETLLHLPENSMGSAAQRAWDVCHFFDQDENFDHGKSGLEGNFHDS
jgi:hypothetical protein